MAYKFLYLPTGSYLAYLRLLKYLKFKGKLKINGTFDFRLSLMLKKI